MAALFRKVPLPFSVNEILASCSVMTYPQETLLRARVSFSAKFLWVSVLFGRLCTFLASRCLVQPHQVEAMRRKHSLPDVVLDILSVSRTFVPSIE